MWRKAFSHHTQHQSLILADVSLQKHVVIVFVCHSTILTFFLSEHAEPHQPQLLLGAGAECELSGPLHEDGDRHSAAGQCHHHPAAQRESGKRGGSFYFRLSTILVYTVKVLAGWCTHCNASWYNVQYANKHVIAVELQVCLPQDVVSVWWTVYELHCSNFPGRKVKCLKTLILLLLLSTNPNEKNQTINNLILLRSMFCEALFLHTVDYCEHGHCGLLWIDPTGTILLP